MRKEKILKLMVVLTIGIILVAMTSSVFAADTNSTVDFFEDTTNQLNTTNTNTNSNTNTNTNANTNTTSTNVNTNTNTTPTTDTSTNTNVNTTNTNNYNTNLPKAGLRENTMMGVAITILAVVAIFAYKKINQYKNI